MNKNTRNGLIVIILFMLFVFGLFRLISFGYQEIDGDGYCEEVYGKGYSYGSAEGYSQRVRSCYTIIGEGKIIQKYFLIHDTYDLCPRFGFFELNKIFRTCGGQK